MHSDFFIFRIAVYALFFLIGVASFLLFSLFYFAGDQGTQITGVGWFLVPSFLFPISLFQLFLTFKKKHLNE